MARIGQFSNTSTVSPVRVPRATAASFGGGQGFDRVADALSKASDAVVENQLRKDELEYHKQISEFRLDSLKRSEELSNIDSDNLVGTYEADFEERSAQLNVPPSMRDRAAQDLNNIKLSFVGKGISEQSRRAGVRAQENFQTVLTANNNAVFLDPSQEQAALDTIRAAAGSIPDPALRQQLLNDGVQGVRASVAGSNALNSPTQFLRDAKAGKYSDLEDLDKFMKAADSQIKSDEAQRKKDLIASREAAIEVQIQNEGEMMDLFADPEISYDQKTLELNKMDLNGLIRDEFAVEARRYLKSEKEINAATNSQAMAEIVTRMYDLNSIADSDPEGYLEGINSVRNDILGRRADGELDREDEIKLNQQMKSLMSAKVSDATNIVALSFGEARKMIENQVPPELRGDAIRKLFYATEEDRIKAEGDKDKRAGLKAAYKAQARQIIDEVNFERRSKTVEKVIDFQKEDDTEEFLKSKGYTMDDVRETAKNHGITEDQVIERLRLQ